MRASYFAVLSNREAKTHIVLHFFPICVKNFTIEKKGSKMPVKKS